MFDAGSNVFNKAFSATTGTLFRLGILPVVFVLCIINSFGRYLAGIRYAIALTGENIRKFLHRFRSRKPPHPQKR